jgi:hypothetical protein
LKPLEIFLGVLTAVGGFVDVSELVLMSQAGSRFDYRLIWVVVLATVDPAADPLIAPASRSAC